MFADAPDNVRLPLRRALRVPLPEPPASAPPSVADRRAFFDAVLLAFAEERDVLPRHLRAFAVQLFRGGARLGVSMDEAARLVSDPAPVEPIVPSG